MKRTKKFISSTLACALMMAQMTMPVMADGGQLDVDLTTKTGVVRVVVPTTMAIAVDQFEIAQSGAQLASGEFTMKNKSEMAVKVNVTSTVTLGASVNLVASANAVETSTSDDVWLAVAAMTSANSIYDDSKTTDKVEASYDLTEANGNVATFTTSGNKAEQAFYLKKATGSANYTMAVADADGKIKVGGKEVSYAKFYELTDANCTNQAGLDAKLAAGDVYSVASANNIHGATLTKNDKGSTLSYASSNKYYTAADTVTAAADISASANYVYATMDGVDGGEAGFTYVAKLSDAKDTWTKDDIKKISIAYEITGVTASNYDEVKDSCTYGLYTDPADAAKAPSIETKTYDYDRTQDLTITVDLGSGNLAAENVASVSWSATQDGSYTEFAKNTKWTYADGTLTFKQGTWGSKTVGDKYYLKVTFDDDAPTSEVLTLTISK